MSDRPPFEAIRIGIVDEVAADAVLVCGPRHFADDVACSCEHCKAAVWCRPHTAAIKTKLCLACALPLMAAEGAVNVTTRAVARDVAGYFAKPRGRA